MSETSAVQVARLLCAICSKTQLAELREHLRIVKGQFTANALGNALQQFLETFEVIR